MKEAGLAAPLSSCLKALLPRAVALAALALALLIAPSARAIMATPTDNYEEAPPRIVEVLQGLEQTRNYFVGAETKVRIMQVGEESGLLYFFVRFEFQGCSVWCPNAVFKDEVSSANFVAFVVLPNESSLFDVIRAPCPDCAPAVTMVFFESGGKSKSVSMSTEGLIF